MGCVGALRGSRWWLCYSVFPNIHCKQPVDGSLMTVTMSKGPGQPPLWQLWLSREPVSIPRRVKSEVPSMQLAGWCIKLVCFLLPSTSFLGSPQLRAVSYLLLESQEVIMKAATQRMLWVTWGFQGGLSLSPLVPHHAAYSTPRISL